MDCISALGLGNHVLVSKYPENCRTVSKVRFLIREVGRSAPEKMLLVESLKLEEFKRLPYKFVLLMTSRGRTSTIATDCTSQGNTQCNNFGYPVCNSDCNLDGDFNPTAFRGGCNLIDIAINCNLPPDCRRFVIAI